MLNKCGGCMGILGLMKVLLESFSPEVSVHIEDLRSYESQTLL